MDDGEKLLRVIRSGKISAVRSILNENNVNYSNPRDGSTPLITAAWNNHFDILVYLVEHGAHINQVDSYLSTPLMHASTFHLRMKSVRYLISKGAKLNKINAGGLTALGYAKGWGVVEIINFLDGLKGPPSLQYIIINLIEEDLELKEKSKILPRMLLQRWKNDNYI